MNFINKMIDIYCSKNNYTFDDNIGKFDRKGIITDKYYKPVFKKGDITIRPKEEVLEQINKYIPPNLPFNANTIIGGGFMLKLVCKQFNIEDYPNTDIDIFTFDNKYLIEFFESIGYEEKVVKGKKIVEYKLKDYKYKFQIIHISFIGDLKHFDFGHNEVFYNGISKQILGSDLFITFIKYQISISSSCNISPKRVIKALNHNLRLISKKCNFEFYPDIFQIIDIIIDDNIRYIEGVKDYIINPENFIFEKHINKYGEVKGDVDIILDKKYKNTEYHFNLLKFMREFCNENIFNLYIVKFGK